jgi:hypothetical protein
MAKPYTCKRHLNDKGRGGFVRWVLGVPVFLCVVLVAAEASPLGVGPHPASPGHVRTASTDGADHLRGDLVAQHGPGREQVRFALERLLGHHSILAIRMMRAIVSTAPNLTQTLRDSLGSNTASLVELVQSVHGREPAELFRRLWTDHNVALIRFAEAVTEKDRANKEASEKRLDRYRRRFGAFVETATNGKLKADTVARALGTHINQLLQQVEAFAERNYARAYRLERAAFAHMFPTGKALAGGLTRHLTGESPVHFDDPGQELRSTLGLLLGEHVELVVDATRAGVAGAPGEFKQAAAALNGNTRDLSEAMDALVGRRNAQRFNDIWSDHIDLFVDYTAAVAGQNPRAKEKAHRALQGFPRRLAAFLAKATGSKSGVEAVSHEVGMHEDLLLRQMDAYAADDFAVAHKVSNQAYHDMFAVAKRLAGLIQAQAKKKAPKGGAQTGGGGTA